MPTLELENIYATQVIAGIDEVGRGALAGPLVAAAVIINPQAEIPNSIDDSKKLSGATRVKLSQIILKNHVCAIGQTSVSEINSMGLTKATLCAINRAIEGLRTKPAMLLIDGNYSFQFDVPSLNIIKGDSKSISIAAASIIAKVYRDNLMHNLALLFPHYGWHSNVGYGAAVHLNAIAEYGISEHHRINYRPCKDTL